MPFKKTPPLYNVWMSMKARCSNPNNPQFKDYGGRGISVCERWKTYSVFAKDMGERPPGTTLDRRDNQGNYNPQNCRWATRKEQQRNQRVTTRVVVEGQSYIAADLADQAGVETRTIVARAKRGLPLSEVLDPTPYTSRSGLALGAEVHRELKLAQTHCKHGHLFTPENTYLTKEGWRNCRQCQNAKMRRRNAAKRANV